MWPPPPSMTATGKSGAAKGGERETEREREREKRERDVATKQFQILPWVAKIVILPLHPYMNAPRVLQERLVSAQGVV